MSALNYHPGFFDAHDLHDARERILTAEISSTDFRWEKETPYLVELILRELEIKHGGLVLDYGCGIGRIARELCAKGAKVIGVDISPQMRALAAGYVNAPGRFLAVSPEELDLLVANGLRFEAGYAVWVLQHCFNPAEDLNRIFNAMKPNARLLVTNNLALRVIPVQEAQAWANDGLDIWRELTNYFGLQRTIPFPSGLGISADRVITRTYMKTFSRY